LGVAALLPKQKRRIFAETPGLKDLLKAVHCRGAVSEACFLHRLKRERELHERVEIIEQIIQTLDGGHGMTSLDFGAEIPIG
jgi:hypothetical protein